MALRPPTQLFHERIMGFGGAGMGKSYAAYTIMKRSVQTRADTEFHIIDTDESIGRMLSDPAFACLLTDEGKPVPQLHLNSVENHAEMIGALDKARTAVKRRSVAAGGFSNDWLFIDMLSPTYDWCQSHFTHEVFRKDLSEYFLEARKAMKNSDKKAQAFEGWKDWPVINTLYKDGVQDPLLRFPGHVFIANEVKALNREQVEADTKALYGPFGVVPTGQKRNPHLPHTVLWFQMPVAGTRVVTTVKDRSRPMLEGEVIKDFALDYLVKVAGWKL